MTKDHIVEEIRRTSAENGGVPLGRQRFLTATGIRESDWRGVYWVRWSDALEEAGLPPNTLQSAFDDAFLLKTLADLIRDLGHFPVVAEIKLRARRSEDFPNAKVFERFGPKADVALRVMEYSRANGYDDVAAICAPLAAEASSQETMEARAKPVVTGSVYLLRFGRHYKIGRSNAVGRRERELAIQLPAKAKLVHTIATDDPIGIEAYWHGRFADRRGNGEWFDLTPDDVAVFRRRKYM